ncbi:MAG TPA: RsmE family RNA methyltransferase [Candidatus Omnitrophota bacterium]|nr:RsmE family RNA methyltransferase [Candidatus Omnitrophota bacterium]HQJ15357.1 RsmE family RNA methyltransferase [Candidatus Omnitrophota bacterium]
MNRFYCSSSDVSGDSIIIKDKGQVHHIRDVIRLKEGERVFVFDDKAHEFDCVIDRITLAQVVFAIRQRIQPKREGRPEITVACAIPRHSKIDDIIDTLTQIGVTRIIPMMTERVVVRLDRAKRAERRVRWLKIALAASKQSQRNTVPAVDEITNVTDVIKLSGDYDLKLIPTLPGDRTQLKDVLNSARPKHILVLIGPEGDFTPGETALAQKAGFVPVSFGDFVFRVETACVYIASVLNYAY